MIVTAAILFGIAAIGGVILAFRSKRPMGLAIVHGAIAATGLVVLIIGVLNGGAGTLPAIALALFVVAALGGFVLFSFHLRDRGLPKGLIYVHGFVAVVAEVLLVLAII